MKAVAYYLPQYYPIPENDQWWGKGFTEWTNVTKAKPLYPGHHQPNLPGELGFYDLRIHEVYVEQAQLAKEYGLGAFCFWHYWFGDGRRMLERQIEEIIKHPQPDFPFCLAWANITWKGSWYGAENQVLVEQTYPGEADVREHFNAVLPVLKDPRYFRVNNKPLFFVYYPHLMPKAKQFTSLWRELAEASGLGGLYLVAYTRPHSPWPPEQYGYDATLIYGHAPTDIVARMHYTPQERLAKLQRHGWLRRKPAVHPYDKVIEAGIPTENTCPHRNFPTVFPNWDNTPRAGRDGLVFTGATPEKFERYLRRAEHYVKDYPKEEQLVFIKSWNEWAEGNYLEPDQVYGRGWLEALKKVVL